VKFLSLEPLLGPLAELNLRGIDWVIVGGESGPEARAIDPALVTDIRDQCRRARVAFFFKQWGGKNKKRAGRILEGRTWDEMPNVKASPRVTATSRSLPVLMGLDQADSSADING
jgi:protein gp37